MSAGNTQLRSLHELYGEKEQPWSEKTEPIIRFWKGESGMLGIAILCCPFRSTLPALLAAPYTLLPVGNDMSHRRPEGSRVLRVSRKAEGHVVEGRW
jgi:hypothetical protein